MSQPPPLRNRPNLHLALTQLNGSPRHLDQATLPASSSSVPYQSSVDTPFGKTAYSPFLSAVSKPPTPYGGSVAFAPRHSSKSHYGHHNWYRIKRTLSSKLVCLILMVAALTVWWFNGGSEELDVVKLGASGLGKEFLQERRMHDYQFFPATNPKVHVCIVDNVCYTKLTVNSTLAGGRQRQIDCEKMELFQVYPSPLIACVIIAKTTYSRCLL